LTCSGYLYKQCSGTGVKWRKRYFHFDRVRKVFVYYHDRADFEKLKHPKRKFSEAKCPNALTTRSLSLSLSRSLRRCLLRRDPGCVCRPHSNQHEEVLRIIGHKR